VAQTRRASRGRRFIVGLRVFDATTRCNVATGGRLHEAAPRTGGMHDKLALDP
jgi:hypothetical protein